MGTQKLGRRIIRGEPDVVYKATVACIVKLFVPPRSLDDETDNPVVVVQVNEAPSIPYGDENSAILPFNWPFDIDLDPGDDLWAVSPGESILVFSVIPR
jgi:hypothetical protein